jgi:pimeloyl-ACP methyl ester carboxylesterase
MGIWPFVTLALVLAVAGVGLYYGLPWPMAIKLLRPPRMTDGKAVYVLKRLSPGDLGLAFEEVTFDVRDKQGGKRLAIAAWWMPHPRAVDRTVVLVHGYADAKVGSIAWAPVWRSLGYHVLAIDLRAHGSSGGVNVTAGFWERYDVGQVIDQLRVLRPGATGEVVLFGVSLGAAVVAAVAAMREDLAAVVLESPFADYPTAVVAHADLMGMPGPAFVRRALKVAERVAAADFMSVAPTRMIAEAKCPVMVISAGEDPLVGASLPLLVDAVGKRADGSVFWEVGGAYHVEGLLSDGEEYGRRIGEFLGAARTAGVVSPDATDAVAVKTRVEGSRSPNGRPC